MSRSPHLPPRCPPPGPQLTRRDDSLFTQSCRFPSEDPFFGEPPCWLDDLLADSGKIPNLPPLRRTCSDSDAILDALSAFQSPIHPIEEGDLHPVAEDQESSDAVKGCESGSVIEDSCVYGPNSPRQKSMLTTSESSMVSAVLENVPSNPLQYLTIDTSSGVNGNASSGTTGASDNFNHPDQEKSFKRRSGQRSRVRKLQYIAELERTVDSLQNMGADLAVQVASLFQLRNALSMENKQLRMQISSLQHAKLINDGQTRALKNEAERLKQMSACHRRSRSVTSCYDPSVFAADASAVNWQMLDMGKLSLNGSPVPPRGGYGL
uniref:BZIP domain-containing protein n=1 Tax=Arundo donax TaxID=35708 RepID=A0A0A9GFA0_ARUDO